MNYVIKVALFASFLHFLSKVLHWTLYRDFKPTTQINAVIKVEVRLVC